MQQINLWRKIMVTKKSNMVMLAVILATLPMYAVAGCKKKAQTLETKSSEIFDEELPIRMETFASEQSRQPDRLLSSVPLSADDEEYDEDTEGDDDEKIDDEEEQDEDNDDEEQYDDEDEDYSDEDDEDYEEDEDSEEDDSDDYSDEDDDDNW
jgi:hypothetical protein